MNGWRFVFSLSVLILNLPICWPTTLICFSFFFNLHAQKHKERDRHKPKHKKTMDMSPSLVLPNIMVPDKVRTLLHSFTPLFCRIVPGQVKYCCTAGWLHCFLVLINLCCSSSLSFTRPDILSSIFDPPIFNRHNFDNCLSLFRCFSLVPVLPFRSTIFLFFLPFYLPPDLQQRQLSGRCHFSAGFLTETTRRRHRPFHQRQLSRSVVHSL